MRSQFREAYRHTILAWANQRRRSASCLWRALALAAVLAFSLSIFALRGELQRFSRLGYVGVFLFTVLAYASVILPVPGTTLVITMGAVLNPVGVGIAAGLGAALGELTGYAVGFAGQGVIENLATYRRIYDWMKQDRWKAFAGLVVLSAFPNPFIDLAGIAAGALRIPIPSFLLALVIGETIKMWLFAFAGAYSIDWIERLSG